MLHKKYRVNKNLIGKIVREGKGFYHDLFTLKILKSKKLINPQFVVIVPKKVNKRAVVRNKIKRKFRASFAVLIEQNNAQNAYYCVIVKNERISKFKSGEIVKMLERYIV